MLINILSCNSSCLIRSHFEFFLPEVKNHIFLYDLTNTYFEGVCANNPKAELIKNSGSNLCEIAWDIVIIMISSMLIWLEKRKISEENVNQIYINEWYIETTHLFVHYRTHGGGLANYPIIWYCWSFASAVVKGEFTTPLPQAVEQTTSTDKPMS